MFELRDRELAEKVFAALSEMDLDIQLMHVCGTHQDTLVRHGLDSRLREVGVRVRQGPGCPVCVTTPREIEEAMCLARAGKIVCSYGDMIRVPGAAGSLSDLRSEGHDVRVVLSVDDAVKMARTSRKEVVFVSVGFETTTPASAACLVADPPQNFSILSAHRTVPEALRLLASSGDVRIQGLIEPGHVSAIIGTFPYEFLSSEFHLPQVVAGFEPLDLLMGVWGLARQIKKGEARMENLYTRVVKENGNPRARACVERVFEPCDVEWRGFPVIPGSGLILRDEYSRWDARKKHSGDLEMLKGETFVENSGCRCGEVLRGLIEGEECPMFGTGCTPSTPVGPCMVSREGSCNILFRYRK